MGAKNFAEKCHIGPIPATMCINVGSAMLAFHSTETDGEKLLEHYLGLIETEGKTFHVATEKCSGNPCPHYQQVSAIFVFRNFAYLEVTQTLKVNLR